MNSGSTNLNKKQGATVPPRRGQIKAQIFGSLVETVTSVASRAGESLTNTFRGTAAGGSDGAGSPASASTPPIPSPSQSPSSDGFPGV